MADNKAYRSQHYKVIEVFGDASEYMCVDCKEVQAYDWSYTHDTDPDVYTNYEPRCRLCHMKYDQHPFLLHGEQHPRSILSESDVRQIKSMLRSGKFLQREIAEIFGVSQRTISSVKIQQHWGHVS